MDNLNKYCIDWNLAKIWSAFTFFLFLIIYLFVDNINLFTSIFITYILTLGLYYDSRIKFNRKILIFFIILILWIISIYINKVPYLIIKDLFWYTLILNSSFIFHVLILSWIYRVCWLNRLEYLCYIISRISYIFSLSFIVYLLELLLSRINLIRLTITNKTLVFILRIIIYTLNLIIIGLRYFIILFHNYVNLIMGLTKINNKSYADRLVIVWKSAEFFILFLFISIIIGYPRLYIVWIFFFINKIYLTLKKDYYIYIYNNLVKDIKEYIKYIIDDSNGDNLNRIFYYYIEEKQKEELINVYNKPYFNLFNFDLLKFLLYEGWNYGCFDVPKLEKAEFPIKSPFIHYSWIDLMQQYYKINDIANEYHEIIIQANKYNWRTVEERFLILLEMCEDINLHESKYRLISTDLPEFLNKEIVKHNNNFYYDSLTDKFYIKD